MYKVETKTAVLTFDTIDYNHTRTYIAEGLQDPNDEGVVYYVASDEGMYLSPFRTMSGELVRHGINDNLNPINK